VQWSSIKPGLIELFTALALDQQGPVAEWQGRPHAVISDRYRYGVYLAITSVAPIGPDESRFEEVVVDGQTMLRETIYGHRRIVLRVQADGIDNTDDRHPLHVIENIRTRLSRQSSRDALGALGLYVTTTGPALPTDYVDGGRRIPRATLDITMLGTSADSDPIPLGWIERVQMTSHIHDAGAELPVPPNVVDELIPES
jgi:hypothetical protein